ncbi:GNAT family protein [Clostridium oceanicum]|uniref:GNAT family protein n=1 Tax=Clostridium oceanicum TaxID=1543 RepID=A0ABN1JBK0_9CLOT
MKKNLGVDINLANGKSREYIIRDESGINIGRIFILEILEKYKSCSLRLNFYKSYDNSEEYLKKILKEFIQLLFRKNICKINIIASENINFKAFIDLGFDLEGVITNKECNEFLFGLDIDSFRKKSIHKDLTLKGKDILLRVLNPTNCEELLDYYIRNKSHLEKFEPTREKEFYTFDFQRKVLIDSYSQYLNGKSIELGIYKEDKFIGKIKVSNIVMGVFKNAIIGYSIDKDYQGNGYMKEAVKIVTEYCFKELGLHRVEASTLVDNEKSKHVLLKCGFKELGINKEYLFIDGKWRDHITFYTVNNC